MDSSEIPQLSRNRSFVIFLSSRVVAALAMQMSAVAVGWQMYSLTKSAFYLGLVGLAQFIPMILLTLVVGYVADHVDRKKIIGICQFFEAMCLAFLAAGSALGIIRKESILCVIALIGAMTSFQGPAMQSMLPNIVRREEFPKAAAFSASAFQFATIVGPALGGILYVLGPTAVYAAAGALVLVSSVVIRFVKLAPREKSSEPVTLRTMLAGFDFIRRKPVVLGAISLDLFAVLFGGATALLPIYADSILHVGSTGLGVLRSAPAVGALLVSFFLTRRPVTRRVGLKMFTAVIGFGLATIVFAVSRNFVLSLAALFLLGACDVVSVVIRQTLVQLETPDPMRGRVGSVNQVFIGTSNQLGEFESGLTASWFGPVGAAIVGGIGTICVVLLWMKLFPPLRKIDRFEQLHAPQPQPAPDPEPANV